MSPAPPQPVLDYEQAGKNVRIVDSSGTLITSTNQLAVGSASLPPANFVYKHLRVATGTGVLGSIEMNLNSLTTGTIYEYVVPPGKVFDFSRVNFVIVDGSIAPTDFGGIVGGLPTGSTFEIIDADANTQLLDFLDEVRIHTNADFVPIAGADVAINDVVGADDQLPIRFSIFKAGRNMLLTEGQRVRWTNWDNLTAITKFRAMVQGMEKDA